MSESRSQELDHSYAVSPELALVDPELAAWARTRLPDPVDALAAQAFRRLTAVPSGEPHPAAATRDRSEKGGVRVLVGVAAALVVTLLLADVRVEVGKTGASAEAPLAPGEPPQALATGAQSQQGAAPRGSSSTTVPPSANPSPPATQPRQLAWAPTPGAEGYHVELYRDNTRIFVAETQRPVVILPARWTLNGTVRTLAPGDLRWYVWPLVDGRRATSAIVQATLTIPPS